ncbi:Formyl-coenzyme A transferase [Delftia tsuruhatensis]|uniref:CoA transferase n=1 Tax=Delftia tsuruhatensis TaxID=180282 RepID=UPI001E6FEB4F|nr:CoA transferase [Delftia tsuruhatensis]CAB5662045.1 Formyl-coenzyme A transferase [Delftia tsuruhatensis]CAC9680231.1 Formyl-coenzyme A transferase [Delftia tsuruhatensis]
MSARPTLHAFDRFAAQIWESLQGAPDACQRLRMQGRGSLHSVFAVSDLAGASMGAAGLAMSELIGLLGVAAPSVAVDRRLASLWFGTTLRPQGWELPGLWDAVAGDYRAADGWIRLHTNAPHHRAAALAVLDVPAERAAVASAVERWSAQALESAVVAQGGCAAAMRGLDAWAVHPQGRAVHQEPLLAWQTHPLSAVASDGRGAAWQPSVQRPLQGLRVLDLTRILAGPAATRWLAGHGAEVLRIDPPGWEEPGTVPEVTLGKRCARLDLHANADRAVFEALLAQADVLVHGYRDGALDALGFGAAWRRGLNPLLVDVSLNAYGWSGPWRQRRGFDSLVQMSAGIADAGMRALGRDRPTPLPLQALDHATGYLMAAAVTMGLVHRLRGQGGSTVRASLARTAHLLAGGGVGDPDGCELEPVDAVADFAAQEEATSWGPALRMRPAVDIAGAAMRWDRAACALGTAAAAW